ncbi:TPA: winged helix-turn-helix transcriptional regulator [Candidatus Woesearchaeota archaeon]|nr:winged helix-turn-helix transcriptional regulator [Candidatus Woesearchaeota archaeon]
MNALDERARYFKALGDPVRLRIVSLLLHGKCTCICDIAEHVGKDQSVVFRHVQILAQAGIVKTKKDGKYLRCCIADPVPMRKLLQLR